jgi:peptidoglycan hydrolase-like protein with peptidoglycan-binding domain
LTDFKIRKEQAMRVLLALSVLGILISADAANAGPSTTVRELSAPADPAIFADKATRQTEARIGLDKRKRRDVQRRLTALGFDTRANGRFNKSTRAVIMRWQEERGYPRTGFLNTLQHQALLTESSATAQADSSSSDKADEDRPARRRGGARHHRSAGGPIGVIGGVVSGVVGGLFGRR